jgi:hypothetical protein
MNWMCRTSGLVSWQSQRFLSSTCFQTFSGAYTATAPNPAVNCETGHLALSFISAVGKNVWKHTFMSPVLSVGALLSTGTALFYFSCSEHTLTLIRVKYEYLQCLLYNLHFLQSTSLLS